MIIAEQFVKGKHDEATCEDGIVATAHFVAAIDGSTSKGVRRVDPEKSNGRLCMEVVADYIRHMDAETSLDDFCEGVTKAIHDIYVERGFTGSEPMAPVDRLCASAVVYSQRRQEDDWRLPVHRGWGAPRQHQASREPHCQEKGRGVQRHGQRACRHDRPWRTGARLRERQRAGGARGVDGGRKQDVCRDRRLPYLSRWHKGRQGGHG